MAEHEPSVGKSDDWYTPVEMFAALGLVFDLDPCSPGASHWVPARKVYTKADDGLSSPWNGLVFMNPPFGGRHGHVPWLLKFFDHANGIAIVRSYTSSDWWHDHMHRAEMMVWPRGKTQFVPSDETRKELEAEAARKGKVWRNAPGHGVVLIGMGRTACDALEQSGLGMVWDRRQKEARMTQRTPEQIIGKDAHLQLIFEGYMVVQIPERCEGCDQNFADPPSKLCPGCQAYRDHQR